MGTYIEIFKLPTLQNGQTHSNNSSAKAVTGCLEDYLLLLISFRMYENFENGVKKRREKANSFHKYCPQQFDRL